MTYVVTKNCKYCSLGAQFIKKPNHFTCSAWLQICIYKGKKPAAQWNIDFRKKMCMFFQMYVSFNICHTTPVTRQNEELITKKLLYIIKILNQDVLVRLKDDIIQYNSNDGTCFQIWNLDSFIISKKANYMIFEIFKKKKKSYTNVSFGGLSFHFSSLLYKNLSFSK